MSDSANMPINVFISHRHIDSDLADIFREEICDWCEGQASVYQSSNAESGRLGAKLDDEITRAIWGSDLLLLIWTDAPGDFDWCMYECGLAQNPAEKTSPPIIVFYTTDDLPDPLDNRIGMSLNEESVQKFVFDFHKTEGFLCNRVEAFRPDVDDKYINRKAEQLYARLTQKAPKAIKDVPVYDRISLGLPTNEVDKINCSRARRRREPGF